MAARSASSSGRREIVRVTYAAAAEIPEIKSLSVVATPARVRLTRQENDQAFTLAAPRMKVKIDKQTGAVSFLDPADHVLLQESAQGRKIEPATQRGIAGDFLRPVFRPAGG